MLYDAWRQTVRQYRDELALIDLSSGEEWTFTQLHAQTDSARQLPPIVFPLGHSSEFVFEVLRAWRSGHVICPLEPDQHKPVVGDLPKNLVHLKITSGSTGAPQLIAFKPEQLMADAENIVATMGLRRDWPNLGVISLAHSYGFSNLILPLLLHGIPLILLGSRLPEAVRQACDRFDAITLPAVPALWRVWHEGQSISPKIKLAISAGALLGASLEQNIFQKTGIKVHNFYGASECGGIAFDDSPAPRNDDSQIGVPMRNVKLEVNPDGCLRVLSKAVGETYWPESKPELGNGCFQTRDLAEIKNGRVFLRGRQSDVINLAGKKIAPEAIEQVILRHPDVRECVVFGVADPVDSRGEFIVACVVGKSGLRSETLSSFLSEKIPAWQLPRQWWFVPTLSNERGKISRNQWREKFLAGQGKRWL